MLKSRFQRIGLLFCSLALAGFQASAANELPQTFTLDGLLTTTGSNTPLLDANAKLTIQILDPSLNCLLYEEEQTVDTATKLGYFNVQVGSHTALVGTDVSYQKRTGLDPGRTMNQIFQNTAPITAAHAPGKTCAGLTYTPSLGMSRVFRLIVTPNGGAPDLLQPDTVMDAVPSAMVAESVQGYKANQLLILGNGDLTQSNMQSVFATGNAVKLTTLLAHDPANFVLKNATNGTIQVPLAATPASPAAGQIWYQAGVLKYWNGSSEQTLSTGSGGGSVSTVTSANSDISVTNPNTTPALTLNTGVGPDQIVKLNGSSQLPAVSGVNITNLNAANLASGTLPIARLPAFTGGDVTSTAGSAALTLATVPVNKGGTAATSFSANQMIVANGAGSALQSFSCPTGNVLKFNASGVAACDTITGVLGYTPANGANYVAKSGDTMTGPLVLASNGLIVGTDQLVVSGGHVGIGTTAPTWRLTNSSASNFTDQTPLGLANVDSFVWEHKSTDTFTGYAAAIVNNYAASTASGLLVKTADVNTGTRIFTANSGGVDRFVIRGDGNIGIGATNPTSALDINGNVSFSSVGSGVASVSGRRSSGTFTMLSNTNSTDGSFIEMYGPTHATRANSLYLGSGPSGDVGFYDYNGTTWDQNMVIRSNGTVGIGTASPSALLHLAAGTSAIGGAPLKFSSGVNLGAVENGAFEFDGTNYYVSSGGVRRTLATTSGGSIGGDISTITNSSGSITMSPMAGNSVIINSTAVSNNTTDGALIINGGAGVSGALNVGGGVNSMATAAANGSNNRNSPPLALTANYWNGSSSVNDRWSITNILGTGTTPTSTLTFDHATGTPGTKSYAFMNGRFGIGTATPTVNLHVHATGSNNSQGWFTAAGTGNAGIFFDGSDGDMSGVDYGSLVQNDDLSIHLTNHGNNPLRFRTSDTNRMTILGDGKVGVGTTTPGARLEVIDDILVSKNFNGFGAALKVSNTDSGAAAYSSLMFENDVASAAGQIFQLSDANSSVGSNALVVRTNLAGPLVFGTNGLTRMSISATGNVGIGTTNPLGPLHINSSVSSGTNFRLTSGDVGGATYGLISSGSTSSGGAGKFHIYDFTTPRSLMVFDSTGNVGIGTIAPTEQLDVAASTGGRIIASNGAGAANRRFTLVQSPTVTNGYGRINAYDQVTGPLPLVLNDVGGNVGIGTATPGARLAVIDDILVSKNFNGFGAALKVSNTDSGAAAYSSLMFENDVASAAGQIFQLSDANSSVGSNALVVRTNLAGPLVFGTNGLTRMSISATGKVGIGTTNPSEALDVGSGNVAMGWESNGITIASTANSAWSSYTNSCSVATKRPLSATCWDGVTLTARPVQFNASGQVRSYNSSGSTTTFSCTVICGQMR